MTWPFPADSPTQRARRVAHAYRQQLYEIDPAAAEELDHRMIGYGQGWVAAKLALHELDDWLSASQAAALAEVPVDYLKVWRRRGRLVGRRAGRSYEYQVREVLRAMGKARRLRLKH